MIVIIAILPANVSEYQFLVKSHKEQILESFERASWGMRLGDILKYPWGYEARARFAELRKEGYVITCTKGKTPSDNWYTIIPPEGDQLRFVA